MQKLFRTLIKSLIKENKNSQKTNLFRGIRSNESYSVDDLEPIFITGVGRSGTHFLASLFNMEESIAGFHLDEVGNAIADSFTFYSNWYGLPMDMSGFLKSREHLAGTNYQAGFRYLESNPYLALSIEDLMKHFPNARFIITWRTPRKVVLSHYNKGWYSNYDPCFSSWGSAPSYQYQIKQSNHFFGRIFPNSESEFTYWKELSQVGKIAWMWKSINIRIKEALVRIPSDRFRVIQIETFDYHRYLNTCAFLQVSPTISSEDFDLKRVSRPGKTTRPKFSEWGSNEEKDFLREIKNFPGFEEI